MSEGPADGSSDRKLKRVFVSYAHEDSVIVELLNAQLSVLKGLDVFIDSHRLKAGEIFTDEIKASIQQTDVAVLVVSSHFLTSPYIQQIELPALVKRLDDFPWLLAQACNWHENELLAERLALHKVGDVGDHHGGDLAGLGPAEQTAALTRIAFKVGKLARSPDDKPPDGSVGAKGGTDESRLRRASDLSGALHTDTHRLKEVATSRAALLEEIAAKLTHDLGEAAAKPIALVGPGGVGKSEVAASVADDSTVRRQFTDGVHSIYVGSDYELADLAADVLARLRVKRKIDGEQDAYRALRSVVASRNALFIFDDVLDGAAASVLSLHGRSSRIVFTGRDAHVFTDSAEVIEIPPLSTSDILSMLSAEGRPAPSDDDLDTIVSATAGRLHHLQLVICDFKSTRNWSETARGLEQVAPTGDDSEPALLGPLRLAFERLSQPDQERFARLSIFPRSHQITLDQAQRAWRADSNSSTKTITALEEAALIERNDANRIGLPKTSHEYASTQLELAAMVHQQFVDSVPHGDGPDFDWSQIDPSDSYMHDNLVRHLVAANNRPAVTSLARSASWIARRIRTRGAIVAAAELGLIAKFTTISEFERLADGVRQRSEVFLGLPDDGSVKATLAYLLADECGACGIEDFGDEANLVRSLVAPPGPSRLLVDTFSGQWGSVVAAEVVPNKGLAAIATEDGYVRLWRMRDLHRHSEFQPGSAEITALAAGPTVIAVATTAGSDHLVTLWDVRKQTQRRHRAMTHSRRITCVALGPNGRRIASASADGIVKLWHAKSGRADLPALQLSAGRAAPGSGSSRNVTVRACRFAPDGSLVAVAASDGLVRLWNTTTGIVAPEFEASSVAVNALDFSPDGSQLVTADAAGDVRAWLLPEGRQIATASTGGTSVLCCRFSPNGELIATGGETGVRLWKASGLTAAHRVELSQRGAVTSCAFTDDSKWLITGAVDGKVRVWDLRQLDDSTRLDIAQTGQMMDCDIDPRGATILTASSSGEVDVHDGYLDEKIDSLVFADEPLAACAHAPAEQAIMTLTESGVVRHMQLDTKSVVEVARCVAEQADPVRTSDTRDLISFAPGGDCVAVVGSEPLALLDRVGEQWVKQNLVDDWAIGAGNARTGSTCTAFVGDGSVLAIGYNDGRIALVRRDTGEELASAQSSDEGIVACAFDRATGELVTACRDGTLVIWRADDLELIRWIGSGHDGDLTGLSMTDRYLYTVGVDGTLRLSSRETGSQVVAIGLGEPAVAVSCRQPLIVATTRPHVHRFLEI